MSHRIPPSTPAGERRRSPRIDLHGDIHVETDSPRDRWHLVDVSAGGVLLQGTGQLSPGQRVECRMTHDDGAWTMAFELEVRHVRPADPARATGEFLIGCAFAEAEAPDVAAGIADLVAYAVGTSLLKW